MVEEKFSGVVDKGLQPNDFQGHPFLPEQCRTVVKTVPIVDGSSVEMHWTAPPEVWTPPPQYPPQNRIL
jgi:hypothetical protein